MVGREMDRRRGESGARGALIGAVAVGAMRRMGPLGLVLGGAWAVKQAYDRRRESRRG